MDHRIVGPSPFDVARDPPSCRVFKAFRQSTQVKLHRHTQVGQALRSESNRTGNSIGNVVPSAPSMIHRVFPTPSGAALQPDELMAKGRHVEEYTPAGVDQREEGQVQVALCQL